MSSAHQRTEKEESGGGKEEQRGEKKERWRKPWLPGKDGGRMVYSGDLRGVRAVRGTAGWEHGDRLPAGEAAVGLDAAAWIFRAGESEPTPPEQQQLHSFQGRERKSGR